MVPTLLALVGLAVLVGLGSWQLARKAWKEALISRIAERTKAAPVPLAEALRRWREGGDVEYLRVRMSGRFRHDAERHMFAVDDKLGPGFHIYTPLETPDKQAVLVNRGFVPALLKEAATRPGGQMSGPVTVTGLVRRPTRPGWFAPPSEPARNFFYWPDYEAMIAVLRDPAAAPLEAGALLPRRRSRPAQCRRLSQGRRDAGRAAEPPPRICPHLVWAGADADRGVRRLRRSVVYGRRARQCIEIHWILFTAQCLPAHF